MSDEERRRSAATMIMGTANPEIEKSVPIKSGQEMRWNAG